MYIFLDTETHSKDKPILIQLAYMYFPNRKPCEWEAVNMLFNTGGPKIEFWAMAVHHITEDMVAKKETFDASEARLDLELLLDKRGCLVAHNAVFDVGVLANHNVKVPEYVCTLKLARYVYPELEAHNLQFLRYALGLHFDTEINPHDALSDVIVLEQLFMHLYNKLGEDMADSQEMNAEILHKRLLDITRAPSLLHKCVFGKYVGTLWRDVPREYLEWIVYKSSFDDADVLHTARFYLTTNTQLPL